MGQSFATANAGVSLSAPATRPPSTLAPDTSSAFGIDAHRLHEEAGIAQSLHRMGTESVNEILGMLSAAEDTTVIARTLAETRDEELETIARGVDRLLICEAPVIEDPRVKTELELRARAGMRVRVLDSMPQWIALFDRRVAVLPAVPGRSSTETLVVRERVMVSSLHSLFAGLWRRAVDLHRHRDPVHTGRDGRVLSLMSSGVTDEAAAREMDVSVRTYRRYVADLMTVLGASSRFQAGVRAAARGWT